jgi:hypothetical protein
MRLLIKFALNVAVGLALLLRAPGAAEVVGAVWVLFAVTELLKAQDGRAHGRR